MASGMIGYCRICAQENEELVSVFGEHGQCLQLHIKLRVCLQVTVMKNDCLPTAICVQCLNKLETCFQLFQLHIKGKSKFKNYQTTSLDLSTKRKTPQSVMHGEHRSFPIKMEEDMFDHPKRRKMRRHLLLEEANATSANTLQPQSSQTETQPETCKCDTCTHARYGELPLLARVIESQTQSVGNEASMDFSSGNITYSVNESGSSSFINVPIMQVPSSVQNVSEQPTSCSPIVSSIVPEQSLPKEETSVPSQSTKKEIPCTFCDKTFTHKGDLNKHRRTHTGERPYECSQCERKFSHASNLLRHQKIHSGERPFTCSLCGKGFSRKDKMLSHSKSATCSKRSDLNITSPGSTSSE